MPITLKELSGSKAKVKAAARELELSELEKLVASLTAELNAEKKRQHEKQSKNRKGQIEKINKLLAQTGLTVDDLKSTVAVGGKKAKVKAKKKTAGKRAKVAPKYRLVVDGVEHLWSGRGRTPLAFAEYFEAGNERDSLLIAE